jgi:hypothetical protein
MTTQELIENAMLDATGLLEEHERADFERALSAATPQIQAHVRREQRRLAYIQSILPDVQPPADLRALVLEAVRREIRLAQESQSRSGGKARAGAALFSLAPTRRVSPMWRAGALGMATAAVVFGAATLAMKSEFDKVSQILEQGQFTREVLDSFGGMADEIFFNPSMQKVVMDRSSSQFSGRAALFINPETNEGMLFCRNLPAEPGRQYSLVLMDEQGHIAETLATVAADGQLKGVRFQVRVSPDARLAIFAPPTESGRAEPVLRTGPLSDLRM